MCKQLGTESYSSTNARDIAAIAFINTNLRRKSTSLSPFTTQTKPQNNLGAILQHGNIFNGVFQSTMKIFSDVAEIVVRKSFRM